MYTQFFGHYLLNKKIVTPEQLQEALEVKNDTKVKLGALAINAGYMTAQQVEEVHEEQKRVDKRIGDIAVSLGYLTDDQVTELLKQQKTANLLLGQALIDKGYITNAQFESAINGYKSESDLNEDDVSDEQLLLVVKDICRSSNIEDDYFYTYIALIIKNFIRFIGDDFVPMNALEISQYRCDCISSQEVCGSFNAYTALCGDSTTLLQLGSRYAQEQLEAYDEYAEAAVGEFLNLQNGLFSVNMSNTKGVELTITPQQAERNAELTFENSGVIVPFAFSFGTLNVVIYEK